MTDDPDLPAWLLACIAEDEHHARAQATDLTERLRRQAERVARLYGDPDPPESQIGPADLLWWTVQEAADHIARHDPARVLADCEAKRRIVELHQGSHECSTYDHNGEVDNCTWVIGDCSTLQLLALPYAARVGYREKWKP